MCVFGPFPSNCQFFFNAPRPSPRYFEYKLRKKRPTQLSVSPTETIGHASSSQSQNEKGVSEWVLGRSQYIRKRNLVGCPPSLPNYPAGRVDGTFVCLLSVSLACLTVRCRYSTFRSICHPESSNWIG
jgi:hypothetical protein